MPGAPLADRVEDPEVERALREGWTSTQVAEALGPRNGQVSLPAALRHRWEARAVLVIDRGDYAIVRPIPADPVPALRGAHAGPGPSTEDTRALEALPDSSGRLP